MRFNTSICTWMLVFQQVLVSHASLSERKVIDSCFLVWFGPALIRCSPCLSHKGALSEEGLLGYLRVLQAFLAQLPVAPASASCQDSGSDSEEEGAEGERRRSTPVSIGAAGCKVVFHSPICS